MRRLTYCLVISTFAFVASGCVNLEAVKTFAQGTETMVAATDSLYRSTLETDASLSVNLVDLGGPPPGAKEEEKKKFTFSGIVDAGDIEAQVREHRAAIGALGAYAVALNDIATFNDDEHVEAASKELGDSLTSFATNLAGTSLNQSALATAIESLAKIYIGVRTRQIIAEKATQAQPDVETIVNVVIEDARRQKQRIIVASAARRAKRDMLFTELGLGFTKAAPPDQAMRTMAASSLVSAEIEDVRGEPLMPAALDQLQQTAKACMEAHRAITTQKLDAKVLKEFFESARQLANAVRAIRG